MVASREAKAHFYAKESFFLTFNRVEYEISLRKKIGISQNSMIFLGFNKKTKEKVACKII